MTNSETLYSSNSYLVVANDAGTEITNMHTGWTLWFEGAKSVELREKIVLSAHTDNILAGYFK
jgi:hypothetical protein